MGASSGMVTPAQATAVLRAAMALRRAVTGTITTLADFFISGSHGLKAVALSDGQGDYRSRSGHRAPRFELLSDVCLKS